MTFSTKHGIDSIFQERIVSMREETLLVHAGLHISDDYDFVNPPVIRASTVLHQSAQDMMNRAMHERDMVKDKIPYATYGSPTHHAFYLSLIHI